MTAAQSSEQNTFRRLAIFAGWSFILSCATWVFLVWLGEYGLRFDRTVGFWLIVVLCGALAARLRMWGRDRGILSNLFAAAVCFLMPAITLPLLAIIGLYIACYGQTHCDL